LPTDLQFVASSDMRISSESLSSPMTTVTGNSRWRQARGEVRGRGCHLWNEYGHPAAGRVHRWKKVETAADLLAVTVIVRSVSDIGADKKKSAS